MKRILFIILCSIPFLASAGDSSQPLIVLDGVPMVHYTIDSIDKDRIAQITILQTDVATKIYGEQGKNGAIIITTRDFVLQSGDSALIHAATDTLQARTNSKQEDRAATYRVRLILFLVVLLGIGWVVLLPIILLIYDRRRGEKVSPAPLYVRVGEYLWDKIIVQILQSGMSLFYLIEIVANGDLPEPQLTYFILFLQLFVMACSLAIFFTYYYVCEYSWGKTLGKKICRTMVVNEDGSRPTRNAIAIRTLCRLIPFDSISFLFTDVDENGNMTRMWHDILSHTRVVRIPITPAEDAPNDLKFGV